jgi:peptide/nickel transport system permease protein
MSRVEMPPTANWLAIGRRVYLGVRKHTSLTMGSVIVLAAIIAALWGPRLTAYDPERMDLDSKLMPPVWQLGTLQHPLGTDGMGRDMVSLLLAGARTSLVISFSAVLLTLLFGCSVGLVAGLVRGWVGEVLMRVVDLQMSFPYFLLAITVASVTRPSLVTLIVILSLADWVIYARLVRGMVLQEAEKDYVQAGIVLGASRPRIAVRYVLPQVLPAIVVLATLEMATMILLESTLDFLGLGVQSMSWGMTLFDGRQYLAAGWWITTLTGFVIFITVLGFNLMGDGLRDLLDPRLKLVR